MKYLLTFLLLLTLSGCSLVSQTGINNNPNSNATSTQNSPTNLQVYKNGAYNFEFTYPTDFVFVNPNYAFLDEKIVQVELSNSSYPNTNFGDAGFAVSIGSAKSQADCLSMNPPEGEGKFLNKKTINGIEYYEANTTGVGAGNLYESKVYRSFRNSTCIEITETVHTSNIQNYEPGKVKEIDKNLIWSKLDSILNTFKLN